MRSFAPSPTIVSISYQTFISSSCVPFSRLGSMGGGRDKLYLLSCYLMPGLVVLGYNYNKIHTASKRENH